MTEESVYNLIPATKAAVAHPPMYRSKHGGVAPPTYSTFGFQSTCKVIGNVSGETEDHGDLSHPGKKAAASFGRNVGLFVNPQQFLKKGEGKLPSTRTEPHQKAAHGKPAVPGRDERPVMGLTTDKNFVVANAVENILAVPKKKSADDVRAVDRTSFGKVPMYISKIKEQLDHQHATLEQQVALQGTTEKQVAELSSEELVELRQQLQVRWDALNKQFCTMTFNLETRAQLRRKEKLESDLKSLEHAMQRLSKPHVLVYSDE